MAHYDRETLALLAMGESGVSTDRGAHLNTCVRCRHDVDQLAAVVATARQVSAQDQLQAPPDAVWQRIVDGIADPADAVQPELAGAESAAPTPAGPAPFSVPMTSVARPARRRLNPAVLAAAAALVGLLIGAGTMFGVTRSNPTPPPAAAPATQIVLHPLDAPAAHGTAVLDHSAGDQRILTVHVQGLPSVPGTFYEVWLMNATPQRLLSLGVLDSSHAGRFQIPAGLDLGRYPVVDISLQPFNGSPAHSGTSAVRGTLPA
jgi:hypothetical protein